MAVQTKTQTTVTYAPIHHKDGRITETVEYLTKSKKKATDTFCKIDDYSGMAFNTLPTRSSILVFLYIVRKMDTENKININSLSRKLIGEWIGITNRHILYALSDLIKLDFIIRISKGNYMANPSISTRVSEEKIKNLKDYYQSLKKDTK